MTSQEYTRIVNLYIDDVKRVAFASCKIAYDSEDITQTVFMKLLKYGGKFESDEHEKKWLIRVTVNECRSFWRSPWKKRVDYFVPEGASAGIPDHSGENVILDAINSINRKCREIVSLYYYEEYSVKEIAEILGISEAAVLKRLQRTREAIKQYLTKGQG